MMLYSIFFINQQYIMSNISNKKLKSLHTNIIRTIFQGNCICYDCSTDKVLTKEDIQQIASYIESIDENYIYQHPKIYTCKQIQFEKIAIYLSKGDSLYLHINGSQQIPKTLLLEMIVRKILRSLNFLYAETIYSCFNPFQDKQNIIPGFSLQPIKDVWGNGLAILPVNMHYQPAVSISGSNLFLDDIKGRFLLKDDIVRVEKHKGLIHFRNGQCIEIKRLKKIKLKNVSGFQLCSRLRNYFERIKESSALMLQQWGIKFDSRFFEVGSTMVNPGSLSLRGNIQKYLNDITFAMSRNTYNHYFRLFFKDAHLQQRFEGEIVFLIPQILIKSTKSIVRQMQKLGQRMSMKMKISNIAFSGFDKPQQLLKLGDIVTRNPQTVKIMVIPNDLSQDQRNNLKQLKQKQINNKTYLHFIQYDEQTQKDELDIIALRHLAVILSTFRLNPWKIKNIPFGDKPTVVASVNVQQNSEGYYSVAIITSLNAFFSKFTAYIQVTQLSKLNQTIYLLLKKCLDKFCSAHKLYPFRVFVYRDGFINNNILHQIGQVKCNFDRYFASIKNSRKSAITYIYHTKNHPYRTYDQSDQNFISHQTVKKTQLLLTYDLAHKFYIQTEMDQPPLQLQIADIEQDPNFVVKILQLTTRLIYATPGNQFGKGHGFLEYGRKLNEYRQYNLRAWQQPLSMGLLMFL